MTFNDLQLSDHCYTRTINGIKNTWDVPVLIQFAKENNYKVFDLPLDGINLSGLMWTIDNMRDIAYHITRINKTDLKYPILLDNLGNICDGWHRVIKAIIEGNKTIKAIRLDEMPDPSCSEKI